MNVPPWAPVLTDGTVTLRAHRPDDVDGVLTQCRDPQMQRWTTVPVPYQRHHAEDFVRTREREWMAGRFLAFAVELEGRFAGTVDLRPDGDGAAEVGYGLAPWARGNGVTERALRLLLPWGFDALDLQAVHWKAVAGNWPSRRVAWSVGFRVEGTVRALLADRGSRADAWIGSLCRGDALSPAHPWYVPAVLTGERAALRPHRLDDITRIAQACNDPLTQQWLPHLPSPYSPTDARVHLEHVAEEHAAASGVSWAVCLDDGPLLGEVSVFGLARGTSRAGELGYRLHPRGRGLGLMTDAVEQVSRHALAPRESGGLGLTRLLIRAGEHNTASRAVAERAGFTPCGVDHRAELFRDGSSGDLLRYERLA